MKEKLPKLLFNRREKWMSPFYKSSFFFALYIAIFYLIFATLISNEKGSIQLYLLNIFVTISRTSSEAYLGFIDLFYFIQTFAYLDKDTKYTC